MINKKLPIVSLVFYILAALILIFAVWSANFSFKYISDLISMGQVDVKESLFEIISFHMGNFGNYIVYAALLFGIGWIVNLFAGVEVETYEYDADEFEVIDDTLGDSKVQEETAEIEETEAED